MWEAIKPLRCADNCTNTKKNILNKQGKTRKIEEKSAGKKNKIKVDKRKKLRRRKIQDKPRKKTVQAKLIYGRPGQCQGLLY